MKERKYTGIRQVAGESKNVDYGFGLYLQVVYDIKEDRPFLNYILIIAGHNLTMKDM